MFARSNLLRLPNVVAAVAAATTLDPNYKGSLIVLSTDKLAASLSGTNEIDQVARSTTSKSSGKLYLEFMLSPANNSTDIGFGFLKGDVDKNAYFFNSGYGVNGDGTITKPNSFTSNSVGTFSSTDVGSLCIDNTAGLFWVARNGSYFGNPVTGTNGTAIPAGTYFVGGSLYSNNHSFAVNFGNKAFTYTIPSGFQMWG